MHCSFRSVMISIIAQILPLFIGHAVGLFQSLPTASSTLPSSSPLAAEEIGKHTTQNYLNSREAVATIDDNTSNSILRNESMPDASAPRSFRNNVQRAIAIVDTTYPRANLYRVRVLLKPGQTPAATSGDFMQIVCDFKANVHGASSIDDWYSIKSHENDWGSWGSITPTHQPLDGDAFRWEDYKFDIGAAYLIVKANGYTGPWGSVKICKDSSKDVPSYIFDYAIAQMIEGIGLDFGSNDPYEVPKPRTGTDGATAATS